MTQDRMPIEPQTGKNDTSRDPMGRPPYTEYASGNGAPRACCEPVWLANLAHRRPDFVFMAPYLAYLLLLPVKDWVPEAYMPWAIAARGLVGLAAFWVVRRHLPPLGKAHWPTAIVVGLLTVVLWAGGQHLLNRVHWGEWCLGDRFFIFPGSPEVKDPRIGLSAFSWWSQAVLRITVATITVPIVEEIFWRGFLLRAFINWDRFEKIPLGAFAWRAFIGTALLSCLQHPDNWGVSILCWLAWNALMYWRKSLLCLMITHGVTNLVLYIYVIRSGDWQFW